MPCQGVAELLLPSVEEVNTVMSTGQNLFHTITRIAFSSTRFCPMSLTHDNRKAQLGKAPGYDKSAEEAWLPFWLVRLLGSCLPVCQADNEVIKGSSVYTW
jgi:hypothetical protein